MNIHVRKKSDANKPEEAKITPETKEAEKAQATADATVETSAENVPPKKTVDEETASLQKALDDVRAELEKIKGELANVTDLRVRLAAEYDNFRKRSQREKDALYADVTASSVAALLPVVDNVERALAAENASAEDMRKGVEMIRTQASQAFEKLGVTAFGAAGEDFDPNLHNCVGTAPAEGVESGKIALVLQKGYKLGDKVIRPAMVQVAE